MNTYTFNYKIGISVLLIALCGLHAAAQKDSTRIKRIPLDSIPQKLNMDATYNRPFLTTGKSGVAIGGYLEANSQFSNTNGVNEGLSFQFRRLTLFFSSTIAKKIKFLSEIEFEDGTKEINIEFASMDIELHPLCNLRGGIILNPIGSFNQNHDGPRWDLIDRPLSATTIIPSTLSNVGFGLYGKHFSHSWTLGYEAYLSNGFDDKIIANTDNRTSLAAGKVNPERFEENNSGIPMFTGKIALRHRKIGELGLSHLNGVFNKWKEDGLILDKKRTVSITAIDFNTSLLHNRIALTGEVAKVWVDVPKTYSQTFARQQFGFFTDIVGTIKQGKMLGWDKAKLNLVARLEYVDYNQERFAETRGKIGDHLWAFVPGLSFRPTGTTVIRFNYRYTEQTDILNNPANQTATIQCGFSSYF